MFTTTSSKPKAYQSPSYLLKKNRLTLYDRYIPNRATSKTPDDSPFALAVKPGSLHHQLIQQTLIPRANGRTFIFSSNKHEEKSLVFAKPEPRKITLSEERVLDAPDMSNDYYTHPIAWSVSDFVMIALNPLEGGLVYTTPAAPTRDKTMVVTHSKQVLGVSVHAVTALGSSQVVSGWHDGCIRFHDIEGKDSDDFTYIQTITASNSPIQSLALTGPHTLIAGDRQGYLTRLDFRVPQRVTARIHTPSRITGLTYDGKDLVASGSDDNQVQLWSLNAFTSTPVKSHTTHTAAVKALAFQGDCLTTVGGDACRKICRWHFNDSTQPIETYQTSGQITGMHYLSNPNHMVTCHGHGDPSLQAWGVTQHNLTQLHHHAFKSNDRALALIKAPDDTDRLAVGLAGETFRFFKTDGLIPKRKTPEHTSTLSPSWQSIR
jgi:WD40 repeat protein